MLLAIDTSTDACSVALKRDAEIIERFVIAPQKHTQLVLPMIQELLIEAKIDLEDLDAIAFGAGPGSFTGVRLCASITQGLAFGAGLPAIKISTLQCIAQQKFEELGVKNVTVIQDARMQEVYYGEYQLGANGIMEAVVPDRLLPGFANEKIYPHAKYIATIAAEYFKMGLAVAAELAQPVYLRDKVAWKKS